MQGMGGHTWPNEFSPAIADRIVEKVSGLTRDVVFSSAHTDEQHLRFPPADKFLTMFFPNFPVDQNMVTGGGIYNTAFDSNLELTAFIRLEADIENRSGRLLEDETFGVYKFLKDVISSLQTWDGPTHPTENNLSLFRWPMRIAPGFKISKKGGSGDTRWAVAHMLFVVSFVGNLGFTYPT